MRALLDGETDFAGFRRQARAFAAAGVPPAELQWVTDEDACGLFASDPGEMPPAPAYEPAVVPVPASFVELCETVAMHRDPQRFALLYRLLWRLPREPALRHDPLDADMLRANAMARAVRRDMHKMRAFVRFREVPDTSASGGVRHVAWFEPEHHIVEANAPWFARRFAQMHWAILTPRRCASWDGESLLLREGARREEAPDPDAGEALWLTYYRNIFNPARLKLATMRKEMPRKYWRNLPEAALIAPLADEAARRSGEMVERAPVAARRRIPVVARAQTPAPDIGSSEALHQAAQSCRRCPLGARATQAVPGEGPLGAALMLVGEQPGDREDLAGRPFVGPAGQLLDRALARAGIDRSTAYLTNAVRHFNYELRGRRRIHKTPGQAEAAACATWLEAEISLVGPQALVALGATAARSLLGRHVAVASERGTWHRRGDGLRVLVTFHPAAILRMPPHAQAEAFEELAADLAAAAAPSAGG